MRRLLLFLSIIVTFSLLTFSCGTGDDTTMYDVSVSVSPDEAGTISPSADSSYEEGEEITLRANSADEYNFVEWTGDIESTDNSYSLTIDEDYNITANFEIKSYELTINKEGEGTVDEEVLEQKSKEYDHGTVVELTAEPAEGWKFVEFQGDIEGTDNPTEITVDEPKEVMAVFQKKTFSLSTNIEGEGTVQKDPDQSEYEYNSSVDLQANPAEGWEFAEWQEDITGSSNPTTITVDEDKSIKAVFNEITKPMFAVGSNRLGQLGDGTTTDKSSPVRITTDVEEISAGAVASFFITADGELMGMGSNAEGELGYDDPGFYWDSPVPVESNVKKAVIGERHSLIIQDDGSLYAMGDNQYGQLGDGTTTNREEPVKIDENVKEVSVGSRHSLYLKEDGTLWAMGDNEYGQLGDGTTSTRITPVNIEIDVKTISAGYRHSLFIKTDGTLYGMGFNFNGQLGLGGSYPTRSTPTKIESDVSLVSGGKNHSLFIKEDGTLWTMGKNESGQLGDGTTSERRSPVEITSNVSQINAGHNHSLFIKDDGTLMGMGLNSDGQLGDGTTTNRATPVEIETNVIEVSGGGAHTLFIKE